MAKNHSKHSESHSDILVAKEFFDRHEVDTGHHEVRGEGVS
jgi:hypothetical protein